MSLICISGKGKAKYIVFVRSKFVFLCVDSLFGVPKCKIIMKTALQNAADIKIVCGDNFAAP